MLDRNGKPLEVGKTAYFCETDAMTGDKHPVNIKELLPAEGRALCTAPNWSDPRSPEREVEVRIRAEWLEVE